MVGQRVGSGSAVYAAAVLEYLTAELLEIAGNDAKSDGKKRITPFNIKRSLKNDEEMKRLLQNVTIGMLG
jgi:histone H2A